MAWSCSKSSIARLMRLAMISPLTGCGKMQEGRHSGARAFAREPGTQDHGPMKSVAWPVFMGSGPGPDGPPRNDTRVFSTLLMLAGNGAGSEYSTAGRRCPLGLGAGRHLAVAQRLRHVPPPDRGRTVEVGGRA